VSVFKLITKKSYKAHEIYISMQARKKVCNQLPVGLTSQKKLTCNSKLLPVEAADE